MNNFFRKELIETKKPKQQISYQRNSLSEGANKNPKHKVIENEVSHSCMKGVSVCLHNAHKQSWLF